MLKYLRSILSFPQAYQLWWRLVGGPAWARVLVAEYICPVPGSHILEIGCGPGTIVRYLPKCDYLGFDLSPKYIEQAKKRFPHAQFICERVSRFSLSAQKSSFDFVLALGIVHHLEDGEAKTLFQIAHAALKTGGKLVTAYAVSIRPES